MPRLDSISDSYTRDVFIKNPDGSEYIGQLWPGYTVFPDWFSENVVEYWTEALTNWSNLGIEFSGIWLDVNEPTSFCDGSWYVRSCALLNIVIQAFFLQRDWR